jgi:hypothetical protein
MEISQARTRQWWSVLDRYCLVPARPFAIASQVPRNDPQQADRSEGSDRVGRHQARGATVPEYADVPVEIVAELRSVCLALPETDEVPAWTGARWRIRRRTFAHVLTIDSAAGPVTVMTFRSSGGELEALLGSGHPFFKLGWGTDVVGMVLDDEADWDEVAELLTESYCILAPKKLVRLVDRPSVSGSRPEIGGST